MVIVYRKSNQYERVVIILNPKEWTFVSTQIKDKKFKSRNAYMNSLIKKAMEEEEEEKLERKLYVRN
jgi:hypothetical protein